MKDFLLLIQKTCLPAGRIKKQSKEFIKKIDEVFITFILAVLAIFLLVIFFLIQIQINNATLLPQPFAVFKEAQYPLILRYAFPKISAESAFILDNSSKVILYAKNANTPFPPASTTKIMTALVALDHYNFNDIMTVETSGASVGGSVIGLVEGEKMTFENLLYAMLLPSANDAAVAIAQNYPGGESTFVNQMNKKSALLHLTHTYFVDPDGLDDKDYTTAHDLALLASFTINHPDFAKIVQTKKTIAQSLDGTTYPLANINKLLGFYGVEGVKTGYTEEAGEVLVTSAVQHGHTLIIVVMKSADRFADTEKLLQFTSENITYVPIHP